MSQENVELVHMLLAQFAHGDLEALAARCNPDVAIHAAEGWPEPGPIVGRDDVIRQFGRLQEDWVAQTIQVKQIRAHEDRVLTEIAWEMQGAASGVPLEIDMSAAFVITGGDVVEIRFFWKWADALETVGLKE
jgi:ketosteroid isomerase-like protein